MKIVCFDEIRDDWYRANQLVPRLVRKALREHTEFVFRRFPRQWIPVFEYYGLHWDKSQAPNQHMPLISEMSEGELRRHCRTASTRGTLRSLVESIVVLDPVLSDFLYILDNSSNHRLDRPPPRLRVQPLGKIRLTNWQSYGRPEIRDFEREVDKISAQKQIAVALPCSRRRPYQSSRVHHRVWRALCENGYGRTKVHQIVVTALGVVPEELWSHPVVLHYDAGVPDIYRVLRLARRFFARSQYRDVIDCLEFPPYSDVLAILWREGTIKHLRRGPARTSRQFYIK